MKKKIFSHTSLLIILSVILTFLAAGTVMYNRYDIYMKQGVRDEAAYIKTGLEEEGDVFLSDRVGDATSSRITLLGKDGQVLFDSIENPEEMENHSNRPEFIEAEKQGSGEMVRYSDTLSKQTFYYAVKLKDDQVLRVARTTDSLLVTMLTSFLLLGGLVCVILVIELFLVQKQTRKLIEPINRIDLEHPLEHVCYEELRPLLFRLDQQNRQIQKQLEDLKNAESARKEFTANVSHELKTPLTAIIGYADMLRSRKLDEEKHFLCANYIYTEGKRLETMALRLLDIIVTRRKEIDRKTTNVSGIFSYLQEIYDETKNPEDSRVKVDICWEKGELYAEENLLKTVLINLTDNAIKASEEGQTVEITGRHMENGYYFQVRDEGIGIPEEELHKITEAFYMVDKSRSRAHNGAGLGLALCTAILELHHSSLKIESTQGFGSCMSFLIPDEGVKSDE